jgi:hypothetical protein
MSSSERLRLAEAYSDPSMKLAQLVQGSLASVTAMMYWFRQ